MYIAVGAEALQAVLAALYHGCIPRATELPLEILTKEDVTDKKTGANALVTKFSSGEHKTFEASYANPDETNTKQLQLYSYWGAVHTPPMHYPMRRVTGGDVAITFAELSPAEICVKMMQALNTPLEINQAWEIPDATATVGRFCGMVSKLSTETTVLSISGIVQDISQQCAMLTDHILAPPTDNVVVYISTVANYTPGIYRYGHMHLALTLNQQVEPYLVPLIPLVRKLRNPNPDARLKEIYDLADNDSERRGVLRLPSHLVIISKKTEEQINAQIDCMLSFSATDAVRIVGHAENSVCFFCEKLAKRKSATPIKYPRLFEFQRGEKDPKFKNGEIQPKVEKNPVMKICPMCLYVCVNAPRSTSPMMDEIVQYLLEDCFRENIKYEMVPDSKGKINVRGMYIWLMPHGSKNTKISTDVNTPVVFMRNVRVIG